MHGKKIEKEKRRPRRLIFDKILELVHVHDVLLVGCHIILLRSFGYTSQHMAFCWWSDYSVVYNYK